MSMTDPLADLLTRIRNANSTGSRIVHAPFSNLKTNVLRVLKEQGFILDYEAELAGDKGVLRIDLKYGPDGEKVIRHLQRVSRPGRRVYCKATQVPNVLDDLGVAVMSTPQGVMSNLEARKLGIGGEVLCEVW